MLQTIPKTSVDSQAAPLRTTTIITQMATRSQAYVAIVVVFVVSVLAFLAVLLSYFLLNTKEAKACKTSICMWYADQIKRSLSPDVDPCDNFYQHVCAGSGKLGRLPVRRVLRDLFERYVIRTIGNDTSMGLLQSEQTKAAFLYNSCVGVLKNQYDEMGLLRSILREATVSWPHRNQSSDILAASLFPILKWYLNGVFSLRLFPEAYPSGISIGFCPYYRLLLRRWGEKQLSEGTIGVGRYRAYFDALVKNYRVAGPTMTFEELQAYEAIILPAFEKAFSLPVEVIVSNLSHVATLTPSVSKDRWKTQLTRLYDFSLGNTVIIIRNLAFFKSFFNLTDVMGEVNMTLYVGWVLAQMAALYINRESIVQYYGNLPNAEVLHKKFCFQMAETLMGPAFTAGYVTSVVTNELYGDVADMVRNIRDAIVNLLSSNAHLGNNVTFPSYAQNVFGRALEFVNGSKPNALRRAYGHYGLMTNSILINLKTVKDGRRASNMTVFSVLPRFDRESPQLFGIIPKELDFVLVPYSIAPPFFSRDVTPAIKYGALGFRIALAFASLLVNKDVAKSVAMTAELEKIARCLSVNDSTGQPTTSDWDEVATLIALRADLAVLNSSSSNVSDRIDGLPSLDGKQTFFVIWCYIQCGDHDAERICNGPLRRTTEFSGVFHCGDGSGMKRSATCSVFGHEM